MKASDTSYNLRSLANAIDKALLDSTEETWAANRDEVLTKFGVQDELGEMTYE